MDKGGCAPRSDPLDVLRRGGPVTRRLGLWVPDGSSIYAKERGRINPGERQILQPSTGHASIESTRIYLHLANDWLEHEYLRAAEAIEALAVATAEAVSS